MQRRRFRQLNSLEERLADEIERLRQEAEALPPGPERERAIRQARQAEVASHMSDWLRSPGLKTPI